MRSPSLTLTEARTIQPGQRVQLTTGLGIFRVRSITTKEVHRRGVYQLRFELEDERYPEVTVTVSHRRIRAILDYPDI